MRSTDLILLISCLFCSALAHAAEVRALDAQNWDELAPVGKEVDAIYGDHVLRSDRLIAVVAQATDTRNANLTVKGVGGTLLDLTERSAPSDQLSCFYPLGGEYQLEGPVAWPVELPS
ncbi:MAG: hypothetical protein AAGF97_15115, partial [Planctomycetota bacterium]